MNRRGMASFDQNDPKRCKTESESPPAFASSPSRRKSEVEEEDEEGDEEEELRPGVSWSPESMVNCHFLTSVGAFAYNGYGQNVTGFVGKCRGCKGEKKLLIRTICIGCSNIYNDCVYLCSNPKSTCFSNWHKKNNILVTRPQFLLDIQAGKEKKLRPYDKDIELN